jgi:hypothetical protein
MPETKIAIKPIRWQLGDAAAAEATDHARLHDRFDAIANVVSAACGQRGNGSAAAMETTGLIAVVHDFLPLMQSLDAQFGADGDLPMADAADAVDESLRCLAGLDAWLDRLAQTDQRESLQSLQLAIGYWAMRHHLPFRAAEPIVNALAAQANRAATRQAAAAVFAMMQGFVAHLAPMLKADLERSNPERAWRVLNLNLGITAIRTGDPLMMRFAFDTLNTHLPDECRGFYEEAAALACQPGFPLETRSLIEAECARWARVH